VTILEILGAALMGTGGAFMLATAIGVVKFPDFYTRLHAAGKGDTLGQGLVLLGLLLVAGEWGIALKLALIVFFLFIFNPTATHALARAAWVSGLKPWRKGDPTEGGA